MQNRRAPALMMTMLLVLAMVLAPMIVAATHGPTSKVIFAEIRDHGHGHADDTDMFPGHDATDHEHQQSAILPSTAADGDTCYRAPIKPVADRPESAIPTCLRRPPRA